MKTSRVYTMEAGLIDMSADPEDMVDIEIQERPDQIVLYIHCNGETVLRISRIKQGIEIQRSGYTPSSSLVK